MTKCAVDYDLARYDKQECLNDEWMTVLEQKVDDKMKEVFSGQNKALFFDVVQDLEYDAIDAYDELVYQMLTTKDANTLLEIQTKLKAMLHPIFDKSITKNIENSRKRIFNY